MHTIAIDCGASFIKGAIIYEGKIIKQVHRQAPMVHCEDDIIIPQQIQTLLPIIRQMLTELVGSQTEVRLCISNEMHGFILAREDGTPYTDYISWQKEYGAIKQEGISAVDILSQPEYAEDIKYTGMALRAGLPSSNLLYLLRSGCISKMGERLYFYTLGDYILRILSGKQPMCHLTNAAATGLYDLRVKNWNVKLLDTVSENYVIFPSIGMEEMIFEFENSKIHALPAIGDQQAALLGAGLKDEQTLSFNLGTGAQVSTLVSKPLCGNQFQIRPYFWGMYLKTIPHLPSGRAVNVYIRFVKEVLSCFQIQAEDEKIWEVLLEEEDKIEGSMICDLSFFENPITDHVTGSISNIGEHSFTIGNLMSSIFKQMGQNFIWAADRIESNPANVDKVVFSGGVARKIKKIRDYIIMHYPKDIEVKVVSDETMMGLYYYGNMK